MPGKSDTPLHGKRRPDGGWDLTAQWPLAGFEGWKVAATFAVGPDFRGAVLYEVSVQPESDAVPSSPLTATMLRAVRLAEMQRWAEGELRAYAVEEQAEPHPIRGFDELADAMARRAGPVRQWTDLRLAKLARQYVRLSETSRSPLRSLAGRRHLSYGATRSAIELARQRGLLQPTIRGRAGGELTQRAIAVLGEE